MIYMEYKSYMINVQNNILKFLDRENDVEENYQDIIYLFNCHDICKNIHELKSVLYLISNITSYHHREPNFFKKIEKILIFLKEGIKDNFSNDQIFDIFKKNQLIILFFIDQKILVIDESISDKMISKNYKYANFFSPDIKELSEDFYEKRKIGENDDYVSQIIRKDLIDEFISYVKKNDYSLNSKIKPSIYETNSFLNNKKVNLIKYAAFFGSEQIFKYLIKNEAKFNSSLVKFAIHGDNPEIIHILEEEKIEINVYKCIKHAIMFHNNDIANYIINNYIELENQNLNEIIAETAFMYYNFFFLPDELNYQYFNMAIKYDYFIIAKHFIVSYPIKHEGKNIYNKSFYDCSFQSAIMQNKTDIIQLLLTQINTITESFFKNCYELTEISIPFSVKTIGNHAFEGCYSLKKITLSSSVIEIGNYSFKDCYSLKEIILPNSVEQIGSYTFTQCVSLQKIKIPSSMYLIGEGAFYECTSLLNISIPSSLIIIEKKTFEKCSSLESVIIPPSVFEIHEKAFMECKSLSQISIPSSVTVIDDYAFYNCTSLKQISILSSMARIGIYAFYKCSSLTGITNLSNSYEKLII